MQTIQFDHPGNPAEVLQLRDVPMPTPKSGEVRIRMIASPVNPSDLLYIEGNYGLKPKLPATPGFEGVGVVEESGGGLLGRFMKGKRVAVLNDTHGNWAEFTIAQAKQCIPIPSDIPDDQAATFFVNPATAYAMTQEVLKVPKGAWLLQTAAGSALGKMVIRLGKEYGFRTINVVRRPEQVEELKRIGADVVIVYEPESSATDLSQSVAETTTSLKYAIDPVGGKLGGEVVRSLGEGGRLLCYGLLSGEPIDVDPRYLITGGQQVEGFWLARWMKEQSLIGKMRLIRKLKAMFRSGLVTTEIAEHFPLSKVSDAVTLAAKKGKGGKVLMDCS